MLPLQNPHDQEHPMEAERLNQLANSLTDLARRGQELRGYL